MLNFCLELARQTRPPGAVTPSLARGCLKDSSSIRPTMPICIDCMCSFRQNSVRETGGCHGGGQEGCQQCQDVKEDEGHGECSKVLFKCNQEEKLNATKQSLTTSRLMLACAKSMEFSLYSLYLNSCRVFSD